MTDEYIALRKTFKEMSGMKSVPEGDPPEEIRQFIRELVFLEDWEAFGLIVGSAMMWSKSSTEAMNAQNVKQAVLAAMRPSEN